MAALVRRYCYYCMCSRSLCDFCQWCTCTAVNLEFYFDGENKLHEAFKEGKIERKIHMRRIQDLQNAIQEQKTEKPEVPPIISEINNLMNPSVNTAQMEESLEYLHEDSYNKEYVEYKALMDLIKGGLVERVTTTVENLTFGNCASLSECALDREKYCHQLKALTAATQSEREVFFYGSFAGALYRQCHQFGLVKDATKQPFKVGCNSIPISS